MPQVAAHFVIAELVKAKLGNPPEIDSHPEAYRLGAVGPDMTLLLFDSLVGNNEALNTVMSIYATLARVADTIGEITEKVSGPLDDFTDWVTGGLSTDISSLIQSAVDAFKAVILMQMIPGTTSTIENPFYGMNVPGVPAEQYITIHAADPNTPIIKAFRTFGHPYTIDPPWRPGPPAIPFSDFWFGHKAWWWMDILHYRRTARFAQELMNRAAGNDLLTAYSLGYWTHVAGDVTGHPFINSIVGGPFRNHALRHMVVENVVDSWVWDHYHNQDIVGSELHKYLDVGSDITAIARHLVETMKIVYTDSASQLGIPNITPELFPNGTPEISDIVRAYHMLYRYLAFSTSNEVEAPVRPPGSPEEFFKEIGNSIESTFNNIQDSFSGARSIWELILAALTAALYGLVLVFKILTLPAAVLIRIATVAPRWLAYYLHYNLYTFVRETQWALAQCGLGKVSRQDLTRPLAQSLYHLPPNTTKPMAFNYPYNKVSRNLQAFWLVDPQFTSAGLEGSPNAESCPYPAGSTPDIFITGPGYDQARDDLLRNFQSAGTGVNGPPNTVEIEQATIDGSQLGNAVDFAVRLITDQYPPASFDLDGDKGYGFISWWGSPPEYSQDLV